MASLPYPRRPPNSFHRTHSKFVCASPPTEFTEFTEISGGGYSPTDFTEYTEVSGGEEPPTDFTDTHRWLGCVGFCGKIVWWLRGYGRMPYPPNLCTSVQSVGEYLTSKTSVASVGRYFCGCVGMAGMPYPPNLCASVQSVGENLASESSVASVGR